jgi:MYXO-CTERM domain-containing protein
VPRRRLRPRFAGGVWELGENGGAAALDGGNQPSSASTLLAQGFNVGLSATNLYLQLVTLGLRQTTETSPITTTIGLYSASGLNPGLLLATSSIQSVSSINPTKYSFDFGSFLLSAGSSYFILLGQNGVSWNNTSLEDTPSEQNGSDYDYYATRRSTNSGSSWNNFVISGGAMSLSMTASSSSPAPEPIPEPGTWAAAALLIGAAAYVRWRRRPQAA